MTTSAAQKAAPQPIHAPADPPWIVQARKELGIHEGTDARANPLVLQMFADALHPEIRNDHRTPWCAAFVGAMLKRAGIKGTGTLWALDYARWGQRLDKPIYGCVAAKERNGGGHVTFIVGESGANWLCLGGNQGDAVNLEAIPKAGFVAYRWPPGLPIPAYAPLPTHLPALANLSEA